MKISAALTRCLPWLNLPGGLLLALLQRAPAVPVAAFEEVGALAVPLGAAVRSAIAAAAALGALHSLAGATQVVASVNSVNTTVGTPIALVAFVTNFPGGSLTTGSYLITGVPPGLTVPGLNPSTGILNVTTPTGTGTITGTPTMAGSYPLTIQAWEFANATGNFTVPITILFTIAPNGATGPPTITTQPASLISAVGESATFTVGVTANPAATYQWKKNSVNIPNATGASLTISPVQFSDAANYVVEVTNTSGTVVSAAATLTVNAFSSPPVFTAQPASQTVNTGATVVFAAAANGAPTPTYQWLHNGTPIVGATNPTLVLTGATTIAGNYSIVAMNTSKSITSSAAALTVTTTSDPGRLVNLSVLTDLSATVANFRVATVIGPRNFSGAKSLLVRAAGPGLVPLGVPGPLSDPQLTLYTGTQAIAANDNWSAALSPTFIRLGAFPFPVNSLDAAVNPAGLAPGDYSVLVNGVNGATGNALAEIWDADTAYAPASPRLINVSVLKQIADGGDLQLGFTVKGSTALTVLIRVIGPSLSLVGVNSPLLNDPQLTLSRTSDQQVVATNDDWGADPQLVSVGNRVSAFAIGTAPTKDAMLLITLPVPPPQGAGYTARATGSGGTGGQAIVEVYEVP